MGDIVQQLFRRKLWQGIEVEEVTELQAARLAQENCPLRQKSAIRSRTF
jgi:hypothetical protein